MTGTPSNELIEMLRRAQLEIQSMIDAKHSGTITIGYGPKGLRFVVNRHEPSVPIKEDSGAVISKR